MASDDLDRSCTISADAEADLTAIVAFIAADRVDAATRMLNRFEDAFAMLTRHPQAGHERPDLPGVRLWTVAPYLIVYAATDERLEILRVVHGARQLGPVDDDTL